MRRHHLLPPVVHQHRGRGALSGPTVANGVVYVPTANDVFASSADCWTGCAPLWTAGSGGTFSNAPYATVTVSDGKVYSASNTWLQVYSTDQEPYHSRTATTDLRPDRRVAAAEVRAEQRLAGRS